MLLETLAKLEFSDTWIAEAETGFRELYGNPAGRYPEAGRKETAIRAPKSLTTDDNVPFAALIHPSNPASGPYSGMSFVLFPVKGAPPLIAMVIGTLGISPDEETLMRPGHARRVQAIARWLNVDHGDGAWLAWAKSDPTRTDTSVPDEVRAAFPQYAAVFSRYGREIYAFCAPNGNTAAADDALWAFLDLLHSERGVRVLGVAKSAAEKLQLSYMGGIMADLAESDLESLVRTRRYVILEGPPGTGKTRAALRLMAGPFAGNGMSVQFHPNTSYETFVGGLGPVTTDTSIGMQFAPLPGVLMTAATQAAASGKPYLLHIDEINRTDLSKVLGEAIYLLEPTEERRITLPYDFPTVGRNLALPSNLHIIGTMNSADRSIAIVDVAIRRRFAFARLWPQLTVVQRAGSTIMIEAFKQLLAIFVEYANDQTLALMPGHSYFIGADDSEAPEALRTNLAPLLREYLDQGYVARFSEPIRSYLQWLDSIRS